MHWSTTAPFPTTQCETSRTRTGLRSPARSNRRALRSSGSRANTELGFPHPEQSRPTMRGFKIAQSKLAHQIRETLQRIAKLEESRAAMPARIPVGNIVKDGVVKLDPERKFLTNLIKMVAYQAESDLVRLVAPHYKRTDQEGRTLIQSALAAPADLEVTAEELRVRIAPLSSPHRSRAIAALCEELNRRSTRFPGSRLCLRYGVGEGS